MGLYFKGEQERERRAGERKEREGREDRFIQGVKPLCTEILRSGGKKEEKKNQNFLY